MTHPGDDDIKGLEALQGVPAPRRTDDAFARSVAADVAKARAPRWLFVPALAAGAAVIGFVIAQPSAPDEIARVLDAGTRTPAPLEVVADADADADAPLALDDVDPGLFTFPALDTSSEQELLAFEKRLDEAMKKQSL
jgi:hypothetical protein